MHPLIPLIFLFRLGTPALRVDNFNPPHPPRPSQKKFAQGAHPRAPRCPCENDIGDAAAALADAVAITNAERVDNKLAVFHGEDE